VLGSLAPVAGSAWAASFSASVVVAAPCASGRGPHTLTPLARNRGFLATLHPSSSESRLSAHLLAVEAGEVLAGGWPRLAGAREVGSSGRLTGRPPFLAGGPAALGCSLVISSSVDTIRSRRYPCASSMDSGVEPRTRTSKAAPRARCSRVNSRLGHLHSDLMNFTFSSSCPNTTR